MEDFRMDHMDNLRERVDALEQQTKAMEAHTRTVERRLRWWRGIAGGMVMLNLLGLALPSGKAQDQQGLPQRVTALEDKLVALTFDAATNVLTITGANLRIVNGLGSTRTINGLGNLIVGYNEPRSGGNIETGSHNIIVGFQHSFTSFGGLVAGWQNDITGDFASVTGGDFNRASAPGSSVCGGTSNTASGVGSVICGGQVNTASGTRSSVSGGSNNTASGFFSSVSGGESNTANGEGSSVSGGSNRSAPGIENWAAGALFQAN
jgi:hypothetical protein